MTAGMLKMLREELRHIIREVAEVSGHGYPFLRNLALRKGLIAGHKDYVRFILLGRSRVGSNFLRGLLNSHSQISVFGEIFQNRDTIGWALPGYGQSPRTLSLFQTSPVQFLEEAVFGIFPLHINAVGFKIFYYHAQGSEWRAVWKYLQDQKDVKIIHLKRRNVLRTHLSKCRAEMTDSWINLSGEKEDRKPVFLDYESCVHDFAQTRNWEREHDLFFAQHSKIEVIYEDLSRDYGTEMKRIQDFLGVDYEPVTPVTYKQSDHALSQSISNYAELRERFSGTMWEEFFVD